MHNRQFKQRGKKGDGEGGGSVDGSTLCHAMVDQCQCGERTILAIMKSVRVCMHDIGSFVYTSIET